jgi:hypothetical protein
MLSFNLPALFVSLVITIVMAILGGLLRACLKMALSNENLIKLHGRRWSALSAALVHFRVAS